MSDTTCRSTSAPHALPFADTIIRPLKCGYPIGFSQAGLIQPVCLWQAPCEQKANHSLAALDGTPMETFFCNTQDKKGQLHMAEVVSCRSRCSPPSPESFKISLTRNTCQLKARKLGRDKLPYGPGVKHALTDAECS